MSQKIYTKKGKKYCPECKAIDERIIEDAFIKSYNLLAGDNSDVLSEFLARLEESLRSTDTTKQLAKINKQINSYELKLKKLLDHLLDGVITQTDYLAKKVEIEDDLQPLYEKQKELQEADTDEKRVKEQIEKCKEVLSVSPVLSEFDRDVFETVIDHVIIGERREDGTADPHKITFVFKAGLNPSPPDHQKTYSLYPDYTPQDRCTGAGGAGGEVQPAYQDRGGSRGYRPICRAGGVCQVGSLAER